jgi:hypothetical protein
MTNEKSIRASKFQNLILRPEPQPVGSRHS